MSRNFKLLFAGRAVSYVGTYLAPIAVAFAILDLHGSATAVGLSFAAWTLGSVALLTGLHLWAFRAWPCSWWRR